MNAKTLLYASFLLAIAAATPSSARAQLPGGHSDNPNGPTVSPYMNLLQNNNQLNGLPTYQSLVKPLVDQQNAIQRQGNSLQRLQQQVSSGASPNGGGSGATGHATRFMNYSHFYTGIRGAR
jgi:hypothetical protein